MRIIVDNSIWTRCLLRESYMGYIVRALVRHELLVSDALLAELLDKSADPDLIPKYWDPYAEKLLVYIEDKSIKIPVTSVVDECRDKNDNYLLALAIDGKANYLITNDNDLLGMNPYRGTIIRTAIDLHLLGTPIDE